MDRHSAPHRWAVAAIVGLAIAAPGCAGGSTTPPAASPRATGSVGPCQADQRFVADVIRQIVVLQAQLVTSETDGAAVQADLDAVQRQVDRIRQHRFVPQLEGAKDQLIRALEQVRDTILAVPSSLPTELPSSLPTALPSSPALEAALRSLIEAVDGMQRGAASCT